MNRVVLSAGQTTTLLLRVALLVDFGGCAGGVAEVREMTDVADVVVEVCGSMCGKGRRVWVLGEGGDGGG